VCTRKDECQWPGAHSITKIQTPVDYEKQPTRMPRVIGEVFLDSNETTRVTVLSLDNRFRLARRSLDNALYLLTTEHAGHCGNPRNNGRGAGFTRCFR
jgi:hypothetical protein